jgi:hypothetical protein
MRARILIFFLSMHALTVVFVRDRFWQENASCESVCPDFDWKIR